MTRLSRLETMSPADCRLQLLVTESLCRAPLGEVLEAALAGGVDLVQVREKGARELRRRVLGEVLEQTRPAGVPVLVNDDVELAAASPVAGVHLGQGDMPCAEARELLGPEAWIGISTHDLDELAAAQAAPATHVGLGACFATGTQPGAPALTPERLAACLAAARLPVFAIGGITPANVAALVARGVRRVAVSACILVADDPRQAARDLRAALDAAPA